jgi:hypothetical protein
MRCSGRRVRGSGRRVRGSGRIPCSTRPPKSPRFERIRVVSSSESMPKTGRDACGARPDTGSRFRPRHADTDDNCNLSLLVRCPVPFGALSCPFRLAKVNTGDNCAACPWRADGFTHAVAARCDSYESRTQRRAMPATAYHTCNNRAVLCVLDTQAGAVGHVSKLDTRPTPSPRPEPWDVLHVQHSPRP